MQLTDGDRIRSLLGTYSRLIDAGDFAGVGALMARAVLCTEDGTPIATGAHEVAGLYAGLVRLHEDGTPGTQHATSNLIIDSMSSGSTLLGAMSVRTTSRGLGAA